MSDVTKPKGGDLARLAAIWCSDAAFRQWLGVTDPAAARARICFICGVESRADLDHNKTAASIFNAAIRMPYRDHLQAIKARQA